MEYRHRKEGVSCMVCLKCDSVMKPRLCTEVEHCGAHEVCTTEAFITSSGTIRFRVGCKDRLFCTASVAAVGKRNVINSEPDSQSGQDKRDVEDYRPRSGTLICSECCDTGLCNSGGCGTQDFDPILGPVCFACSTQIGTDSCQKIEQCGRDKICGITPITVPGEPNAYMTSCRHPWDCNPQLSSPLGTGSLSCSACCNQSLCNSFSSGADVCKSHSSWGTTPPSTSVTTAPTMKPSPSPIPKNSVTQAIPTMPVTSTLATHTSAGFCQYKGKLYGQGQRWKDGCQYNCTCINGKTGFYTCVDICPTYHNLPAYCFLQRDPGECCHRKVCSGTTPTRLKGCVYKKHLYGLGETWIDNCQYNCTCIDGTTGFYKCKELCLAWTLPPVCYFDPPTPGKCCPTPNCPPSVIVQYPSGYIQQ